MASLAKSTSNGKAYFRLQFTADGKRRTLHLGSVRESAANKIKGMIETLVDATRLNYKPDQHVQTWLLDADIGLIDKLERWGLTDCVAEVIAERRRRESPVTSTGLTLDEFVAWYIDQRKSDCEKSTIKKLTASLKQLCDYCRDIEPIFSVDALDSTLAFRYQRHRLKHKAEATAAGDVKVAKAAFVFGVKSGKVACNPFADLKLGSEVNLDNHHILPISDYERLIKACPNSTWRVIIALARLGGLRCPSELAGLLWQHVNWEKEKGTVLITSPKTRRYGKAQRTIPLFSRLETELADHFELTGETSRFVIDFEPLRRPGASLSTRFHKIREKAGIAYFPSPFRNMRLSAANDVARSPGITPKNLEDWFGHDLKTALKHYHRTTEGDFAAAVSNDPFQDQIIAGRVDVKSDAESYARTPRHKVAVTVKPRKNEVWGSTETQENANNYPTRIRT